MHNEQQEAADRAAVFRVLGEVPVPVGTVVRDSGLPRIRVGTALLGLIERGDVEQCGEALFRRARPFHVSARTAQGIADALAPKAGAGVEVERAAAGRRVMPLCASEEEA